MQKLWRKDKTDEKSRDEIRAKSGRAGAQDCKSSDGNMDWEKVAGIASVYEGFFEVEKILAKRTRKALIQYLVKWRGFEKEKNTWVDVNDIRYGFLTSQMAADDQLMKSQILVARIKNDFLSIPNEIISHILCFLDRRSYAACKLVCRRWQAAAKSVQPEFNLRNLTKEMKDRFGDDWFKNHFVGNVPTNWSAYPFYPLHYKLANELVANSMERIHVFYPASWKGKELTAIGVIWKDENLRQRDAVLQRTSYWNENGRMKGIAACCRVVGRRRGFGQFQHWHQAHGRLSMEEHLEHVPKSSIPLTIERLESMLNNVTKLSILQTWYDIQSGQGPDIPI